MYKIRIRLDPHSKVDKDMYWELEKVKMHCKITVILLASVAWWISLLAHNSVVIGLNPDCGNVWD